MCKNSMLNLKKISIINVDSSDFKYVNKGDSYGDDN